MKKKIKNALEDKENDFNDPIEKCAICGEDTPYMFSTPISKRAYYFEGVGQICQACHYKIFIKEKGE